MNMYLNTAFPGPWRHPAYNNWNSNDWSYHWNPHYYNWFGSSASPYYRYIKLMDYGAQPFVVDIEEAAEQNRTFRTALWTGKYFQVTLMSINVGDDIGLEVHPNTDQFIRIEEGHGLVQMGDRKDHLNFQAMVNDDDAIMIPAGKWHNVINTGNKPLKVSVIYAPPEHPFGTVHETKAAAMSAEGQRHD